MLYYSLLTKVNSEQLFYVNSYMEQLSDYYHQPLKVNFSKDGTVIQNILEPQSLEEVKHFRVAVNYIVGKNGIEEILYQTEIDPKWEMSPAEINSFMSHPAFLSQFGNLDIEARVTFFNGLLLTKKHPIAIENGWDVGGLFIPKKLMHRIDFHVNHD